MIHSLDPDEIQQLNDDLEANSWRIMSLFEIENVFNLLRLFQMFYSYSGSLPLTNGLLVVSDGK